MTLWVLYIEECGRWQFASKPLVGTLFTRRYLDFLHKAHYLHELGHSPNTNIISRVNKINIRDLLQRSYDIVVPILHAFMGANVTLVFLHSPEYGSYLDPYSSM